MCPLVGDVLVEQRRRGQNFVSEWNPTQPKNVLKQIGNKKNKRALNITSFDKFVKKMSRIHNLLVSIFGGSPDLKNEF